MKKQNRIAIFNIVSVVLLNGISIFTGPLFVRLLGDRGYGILKIYNIWVSVIAIVFTLQTQGTLVNARVEYDEKEQEPYQSSVMSLSVLFFALCSLLVLLFLRPIAQLLKLSPLLVCLMLVQAFGTFAVGFLSTKYIYEYKAGRNMVVSLVAALFSLALSLVLVLNMPTESRYYGRAIGNAATYGLLGIPVAIAILVKGKTFFHRGYWKFCVALAVPAVFHNLSDLILGQSDQVMLQHMIGEAEVGRYGITWTLANVMFVIFGALNKTWCPFFFDEVKQGKQDAMMEKTVNFLELFTVLSMGFILLAPEVLWLYKGERMEDGNLILPMFVSSYYLNFLCTFPVNFEYYHKKTKVVAEVTIGSSLLNVVLNYFLIGAMGMSGAALATAISHGAQLTLHYVYTRYLLGKGDYPFGIRLWWKYAAAYFAMVAFVYATGNLWLLRWGLGALLGLWELLRIKKRKVLI